MLDPPKGGFKHMEGEAGLPTNHKKGRTDNRKIIMGTVQGRVDQR